MSRTKRTWLLFGVVVMLAWFLFVAVVDVVHREETTAPSRMLSTGVPTVYGGQAQSWASASTAIPPARATADPLYPGNQVLSFDCYAYLENV